MSKYRVKTDQFKNYELGDVVEYDDLTPLMQHCVDTGYDCFEEIEDGFKVGDWVYWDGMNSTIGKIKKPCSSFADSWELEMTSSKGSHTSCSEEYLRKATDDEIKQALVKEANKRYSIGDSVKRPSTKEVRFGNGVSVIESSSAVYKPEYDRLEYDGITVYQAGEWAERVDQTPDITINGYDAEFHDNYVQFGCAKIAVTLINTLVDDLLLLNRRHRKDNDNNRHISGIKIGDGLFSIGDIKKISKYYEGKS